MVDFHGLAQVLARHLTKVVPPGFHVTANEAKLIYSSDSGRFPGQQGDYRVGTAATLLDQSFSEDERVNEAKVVQIAFNVLDDLQDYVDEASHEPWPGDRSPPRPHAEIRGPFLHMWYGEPEAPALACDPIALSEIL